MQKCAQLNLLSIRNCNVMCLRYARKRMIDPGISHINKLFNEKQLDQLDSMNYEQLEADFENLGLSHKEHVHEIVGMKEKEKYHIVRQKYFKEKYPNFLTWADKQQIKILHAKDPDKWTIDKLSEGFPAITDVIRKIIKSNWTKKSAKKVETHDAMVVENWSQFKNGKLEVPQFLVEHLNKFTERKLNLNVIDPSEYVKTIEITLPQGEFSHIITSYQSKATQKQIGAKITPVERHPKKHTYITEDPEEFDVKESLTFNAYKNQLRQQIENKNELSEIDRAIFNTETDIIINNGKKEIEVNVAKYIDYKGNVSLYCKNKADYSHLEYPEKIIIPLKIRKRGFTYKLYDCYYDYDGEFLYRIPGMH